MQIHLQVGENLPECSGFQTYVLSHLLEFLGGE